MDDRFLLPLIAALVRKRWDEAATTKTETGSSLVSLLFTEHF